jgi:hypothetical protein
MPPFLAQIAFINAIMRQVLRAVDRNAYRAPTI